MIGLYRIYIFIILYSIIQHTYAETIDVLTISKNYGLSESVVNAIDFDDNGYLWIGTDNGLNRFNGYEMKVFKSSLNNNLKDDQIKDLYFCNDTLWFATQTHSLCAYVLSQDKFIDFSNYLNFKENPLVKYSYFVYPLSSDLLIIGTAQGVILFNKKDYTNHIFRIPNFSDNDFVRSIIKLDENKYLVGTNFSGVFFFDLNDKNSGFEKLNLLKGYHIKTFYRFSPSQILIGTSKGIFLYNQEDNTVTQILNPIDNQDPIMSINRWNNDKLLIGGIRNAYFLYNNFKWTKVNFIDHSGKKLDTFISNFKKDKYGGYWIGTQSGEGIFYYHPHQRRFTPYRIDTGDSKNQLISIFNFLREGNYLWLAAELGITRYKIGTNEYKYYRTSGLMYSLAKDSCNNIWAGGIGIGLLKYNRKKDKFEKFALPVKDRDVIKLTVVNKDSIWIHTRSSGIYSLNIHNNGVNQIKIDNKIIRRSRSGYIDSSNNRWIGTEDGLYKIKESGNTDFYSFFNNRIFSIAEDPDKNIWVGTAKGLNKIDCKTNKIKLYTEQLGLPNDFIYGIESDKKGNIWVSTNYGVSKLNKETDSFNNFTEEDGMQNNEFNGKAYYKDSLGYIYFGGMNGFNIFNPDSVFINKNVGKTFVEDVKLFGKSMNLNTIYADSLIFSYKQNVLTFKYSSLNYLWVQKNRFQYKMVGFDKKWRPVTNERSTTYTNLDPGTYTFKVKSCNNDKIWGEPASLTITIKSPWYRNKLFYAATLSIIILMSMGILLLINHRQHVINRRLAEMVTERTQELTKSNESLNNSLLVTQQQKENITFLMRELNHRVKNHLQLITSLIDLQDSSITDVFAKEKLRSLQSKVFTISKIHNFLKYNDEKSELYIDEFLIGLSKDLVDFSSKQISLNLNFISVPFPVSRLTYLGLILNELLSNTLKYAFDENKTDRRINISLRKEDKLLKLVYQDNGKGFNQQRINNNNHIGLNLIKTLVRGLKGSYKIESDKGFIFILNFPQNINHGKENPNTRG